MVPVGLNPPLRWAVSKIGAATDGDGAGGGGGEHGARLGHHHVLGRVVAHGGDGVVAGVAAVRRRPLVGAGLVGDEGRRVVGAGAGDGDGRVEDRRQARAVAGTEEAEGDRARGVRAPHEVGVVEDRPADLVVGRGDRGEARRGGQGEAAVDLDGGEGEGGGRQAHRQDPAQETATTPTGHGRRQRRSELAQPPPAHRHRPMSVSPAGVEAPVCCTDSSRTPVIPLRRDSPRSPAPRLPAGNLLNRGASML